MVQKKKKKSRKVTDVDFSEMSLADMIIVLDAICFRLCDMLNEQLKTPTPEDCPEIICGMTQAQVPCESCINEPICKYSKK